VEGEEHSVKMMRYQVSQHEQEEAKVFILIFTPQLGIGLHQGLLAYGVLNFHLGLSRNIYARL
jgi:hypothetical protein